jgi:hypothetical protein
MTLEEAKVLAQQGVKMTHEYFCDYEWLIIMNGNLITFEDGVQIFVNEWVENKEYLLYGWFKFNNKKIKL